MKRFLLWLTFPFGHLLTKGIDMTRSEHLAEYRKSHSVDVIMAYALNSQNHTESALDLAMLAQEIQDLRQELMKAKLRKALRS